METTPKVINGFSLPKINELINSDLLQLDEVNQ